LARLTTAEERVLGELMGRAQGGDQQAYERVLRELAVLVRHFAARRRAGASVGEDLVQDVLLTVHRVRRTYDPERPFAPWFYAIVQSRFIDLCRRERRRARAEISGDELLLDQPRPGSRPVRYDRADEIRSALAELPPAQRRIIHWLKLDGLSVRQIAGRLRMSESAVKVAAHRGYAALRRRLRAER